ncbi:Target of EGR1, member 1 (Nuclear) [Mortierella antarctica]|nr:Target of EGR1, member 1 (Nuclear) [Mortierella antarctica]
MPPKAVPLPTYNQVTKHNLAAIQPMIVQLLKHASFIALDAEFTGLGSNLSATRANDMQERYHNLSNLAKSHALVAFGLSIFILDKAQGSDTPNPDQAYKVHNFNFSMLFEKDYMVSPRSMLFLAENGLDLNQWILEGIPYTGGDRLNNQGGRGNPNGIMRSIFKRIMNQHVPVVVHNGFLDLIFLYHSFYADLPPNLAMFVADLSDMFPGGLYDTKYVSDYITREQSSFLAYLFRKYERQDARSSSQHKSKDTPDSKPVKFYSTFDVQGRLPLPPQLTRQEPTSVVPEKNANQPVFCQDYARHGVCKKNMKCGRSHDLDVILDAEEAAMEAKKNKRRKTKANTDTSDQVADNTTPQHEVVMSILPQNDASETSAHRPKEDTENVTSGAPDVNRDNTSEKPDASTETLCTSGTTKVMAQTIADETLKRSCSSGGASAEKFHSAYFDAFMTGTIFAHQLNEHGSTEVETSAKNNIYLIGKSFPLKIEKSVFSKFSPGHERQRQGARVPEK